MTKIQTLVFSSLVLGNALLQGCAGGNGGEPVANAGIAGVVLGQMAATFQNLPSSNSNSVPSLPVTGVTTSSVRQRITGCETITPDVIVDADDDDIAAEKKYTFDCNGTIDGDSSYTRKGTLLIKDMDEAVAGLIGGIRVDYDLPVFESTTVADGNSFKYSHSGFWEFQKKGDSLVSTSDYTGMTKYQSGGFDKDYTFHYTWDYAVTPTNPTEATFWTAGKVEFSGEFEMTGKIVIEVDGKHTPYEGKWVIKYYTEDLNYDSTCSKWYKSGSIVMDDSTNKFEYKYNCNTFEFYHNGVKSDWITAD